MKLLTLLIVLAIATIFQFRPLLQRDSAFMAFRDWMARHALFEPGSALAILLGVVPPTLLVGLFLALLQGWLLGLVGLVANIIILLYSLDRKDLVADLSAYRSAWNRGDAHAAWQIAVDRQLLSAQCAPAAAAELNRAVVQGVAVRALSGFFTIIFWYFLLGPMGALFLRLIQLPDAAEIAPPAQSSAERILELAHWLPVRLLGGCFMLAGDWERAWPRWIDALTDVKTPARELIGSLALAAIAIDEAADEGDAAAMSAVHGTEDSLVQNGDNQLESVVALIRRALIIWTAIFALMTLLV